MDDWALTYNGLTINDSGQDYGVQKLEGFDPPDVRADVIEKAEEHGAFIFADFYPHRVITISGDLVGEPGSDFEDKVTALRAAFLAQTEALPLTYQFAGSVEKLIYVKPVRTSFPIERSYGMGYCNWAVQLLAEDPRLYSSTEDSGSTGAVVGLGMDFSTDFSIDFGGGSGGSTVVTNDGIFPTPPTFTITGPSQNPKVKHLGNGKSLTVGLTMVSGDTLVIDAFDKTIMLNGASRYDALTEGSEWFDLDAGDNEIQYIADGATGSTCTITFRDAWM